MVFKSDSCSSDAVEDNVNDANKPCSSPINVTAHHLVCSHLSTSVKYSLTYFLNRTMFVSALITVYTYTKHNICYQIACSIHMQKTHIFCKNIFLYSIRILKSK